MENEKIFVVVPVYKVEAYLERCIDSILNQTYTNWELVLVDDGSPDSCPAICDRYAAEYENITVIHQENGGLSAARNAGIDYAFRCGNSEQDWINFIDSDDFVHPLYLEHLYHAAKDAEVELGCCSFIPTSTSIIDSSNVFLSSIVSPAEDFWYLNHRDAIPAWAKLYRLVLFSDIRYPLGKICEDQFTTYKLVFQCNGIAFVPEKLYYYYQSDASIMRSPWTPRRMNNLEALREQKSFFLAHGYTNAYKVTCEYFLHASISHLTTMEHLRYDKIAQITLKKELYSAFFKYAKEFGYPNALRIWFSRRFTPWSKWKFKHSIITRIIQKIKRMIS